MQTSPSLARSALLAAATAIGVAFMVPVLSSIHEGSFSLLDGSAPTIAIMIYVLMLPLLCVSAPGVMGGALGIAGAAFSGWACGQAAVLAQQGDVRLAAGLVAVAVLFVALVVMVMRRLAARRQQQVVRLVRRFHELTEGVTEAQRERYHNVPLHRGGPNPIADAMLVDRLVNGAIGAAAGTDSRNTFFRELVASLRDLRDSLHHQQNQGYAAICLDEHLHCLGDELRRQGANLRPVHKAHKTAGRQHVAARHGHGQPAH